MMYYTLEEIQEIIQQDGIPIYFGGSFDPFHLGHQAIVLRLQREFPQSKVFLMPNRLSPFKASNANLRKDKLMERRERAFCIMRAALRGLRKKVSQSGGNPDLLQLESHELYGSGPAYTADSIQYLLQKKYQNKKQCICFTMGLDSFISLPQWFQWNYLRSVCIFLVFLRVPLNSHEKSLYDFKTTKKWGNKNGFRHGIVPLSMPIASQEIRSKIAKREDVSTFLSQEVLECLDKWNFYR